MASENGPLPSIRSQIALLVLACALPSIIGLGVLVQHFYQREQLQIQRDTLETARALAAAIGHDIGEVESTALALASSPSLGQGNFAAFAAQAGSQLRPAMPAIRFLLIDDAGRVQADTGAEQPDAPPDATASPAPAASSAHAHGLRAVFERKQPVLTSVYLGQQPGVPRLAVNVPVLEGDKVRYVLSAVLRSGELPALIAEQQLPSHILVTLLDEQGLVAARSRDEKKYAGKAAPAAILQLLHQQDEGVLHTVALDGITVFAGVSRLPGQRWAVTVGLPEERALDSELPAVPLVSGAVGLLVLAGIAMAWMMGGQIGRSVRSLTGPARALATGTPMALSDMSFKEAHDVAMALKQVEVDVLRHRHELETLVAERTAQLAASKALLENVYASAPVGLSFVDLDLRIVMLNDYLAAINGLPVADHIGKMFGDVIHDAKVKQEVERNYRDVLATGAAVTGIELTGTVPGRPEQARHLLAGYFPVRAADGRMIGITGLLLDITTQKNIESQLRQSKQLFKSVVDYMPAILFVKDAANLRYEVMNHQAERTFGRPRSHFLGKDDYALFPPEQAATFVKADRMVLASGEVIEVAEELVTSADGDKHVLNTRKVALRNEEGRVTHLLGMAIDISERKRSEEAFQTSSLSLARNNTFIRTVTDNLPGMVVYWDAEQRCRFANRYFAEFMGMSVNEIVGATIPEVLGEELYRRNRARIEGVLAGERQTFYQDRPQRNGDSRFVLANYIPDLDEHGVARGFFVMVSDVTEMKTTEMRLHDLNEQLVRARDRAEAASRAKSAFVANMSHEIRTPMNAIIGLARLLEEAPLERRERSYLGKIQLATQSLLAVVNDVLDFSKIEAGQLKLERSQFSLDHVLTSIGVLVGQNAWNKGVEPIFDLAPDVPTELVGDAMRLQQVLLNLTGNAVKFTERGEVVLSVRQLAATATSATLEFSVRDTGIGISVAQQERLFEAFSQGDNSTSRQYGGTGLGLAICRRLVDLMNSSISLNSELGRGSLFRFACTFERAVHGLPAPKRLPVAVESLSLLIVEDNATVLAMLTRHCQALGWRVYGAASGAAGLAMLHKLAPAEQVPQIDLLLLDAGLSDMDGISLLTQAHTDAALRLPPTILMAPDHYTEELLPIADSLHIASVLAKPTTPAHLLAAVTAVLTGTARDAVLPGHTPLSGRLAGVRVLLVEDNEINQEMAQYILLHAGARVEIAGNGRIAVDMLAASPDRCDAVLMDLQMPVMNGYQATAELRAMGLRDLPIIAMTANALDEDRLLAIEAGVNAHVPKPIDVDEMIATLVRLVPQRDERPLPDDGWRQPQAGDRPASLPGIDLEAGLSRMGGNYPAFVGLLKRFENSQGGTVAEVRSALARDKRHAAQLLHRLRGVAANLGAGDIAHLCAQAELALHDSREAELAMLLTALEQALAVVTGAVRTLPLPVQPAPPGAVPNGRGAAAPAELPQALQDLLCLLETNNMKAMTHFQSLRPALDSRGHGSVPALANAVETLDFAAAAHLVKDMLKRKDTA